MIIKILMFIAAASMLSFNPIGSTYSKWIITEKSSLTIRGTTNINRFSCAILNPPNKDTVTINREDGMQVALNGRVSLNIKNFDCNNILMTKQLRKTLKEDKFPYLQVTFLSLNEVLASKQINNSMNGVVEIELAGTKKRFSISYQLRNSNGMIVLLGTQAINFSDFNLDPPQKIGKLIKVHNELSVAFELNLQLVTRKET